VLRGGSFAASLAHPRDVSQFLSSGRALAVQRNPARARRVTAVASPRARRGTLAARPAWRYPALSLVS
jgi:hypothetical protein